MMPNGFTKERRNEEILIALKTAGPSTAKELYSKLNRQTINHVCPGQLPGILKTMTGSKVRVIGEIGNCNIYEAVE